MKGFINQVDEFGRTPLYTAVSREFRDVIKILLEKGADVHKNNEDKDKKTH